jgi:PIN domain nuclease of toxin-antitoxin system
MVLLDTQIMLVALGQSTIVLPSAMKSFLTQHDGMYVSVATLWELAIKYRLGKIGLSVQLLDVSELLEDLNIGILPIQTAHVVADIGPQPRTKDPFDRLLLGVCAVENKRLVTIDEKLVDHPLAWR